MKTWEYLIETHMTGQDGNVRIKGVENKTVAMAPAAYLNFLGMIGWELVAMTDKSWGMFEIVMKRPMVPA